MYDINLTEEELKNKVGDDFFKNFDYSERVNNIDFMVLPKKKIFTKKQYFLWAEAKKGNKANIIHSLIQLILTIGKSKINDKEIPPLFLGAFDAEKMVLIEYENIVPVFNQNDFNWNVAPSDHSSKEFSQLEGLIGEILEEEKLLFYFSQDKKELREFIQNNFILNMASPHKIAITKTNFTHIFQKWRKVVMPTIGIDWERAKKSGILEGDFYLADCLSLENQTIQEKLYVLLKEKHYVLDRRIDDSGLIHFYEANFLDHQQAHRSFWRIYERPPKKEFWDFMIKRRDLLVPEDVRERKGAFFTPQIWVQKAQEYLAAALGEDWQENYCVWDCAAGTGNLLAGLTEKRNIYASTLDKADVDIMHERIANGANLLPGHVFQFDFLNDHFLDETNHSGEVIQKSKLPQSLQAILKDEKKRKKLVIFINPPYAEAGTSKQVTGTGKNKTGVSNVGKIWQENQHLGLGIRELYAQFFVRVYKEIPNCILASFSTLKYVNGSAFTQFRKEFKARFFQGFLVPANTFDNVEGKFPIGFLVWNLNNPTQMQQNKIRLDIYGETGKFIGKKSFFVNDLKKKRTISQWITGFKPSAKILAFTGNQGPDFQNNRYLALHARQKKLSSGNLNNATKYKITPFNLIPIGIYFAVRHAIQPTWINNRDQFLYPNTQWEKDTEFQNDCLALMLFHGQNKISNKEGINHFIPFTESEVGAKEAFTSNFMVSFLRGKATQETLDVLPQKALEWSREAEALFKAGRAIWRYYHQRSSPQHYQVNASLYDIKAYFQGRNAKGKMNAKSQDEEFNALIDQLSTALKQLAEKITPKIYAYGFLRK